MGLHGQKRGQKKESGGEDEEEVEGNDGDRKQKSGKKKRVDLSSLFE